MRLPRELGSDVPYFFVGGTALGLGRGEEVYPLEDLPRCGWCWSCRRSASPRKDAYAWLDETRKGVGSAFAAAANLDPVLCRRPLGERSRGARHRAPSRDRPIEAARCGDGRAAGGHVGQRLDGVWRVRVAERAGPRGRARWKERGPRRWRARFLPAASG